jgi:malate synthase
MGRPGFDSEGGSTLSRHARLSSMPDSLRGISVSGAELPSSAEILTPEALAFVAELHRSFNPRRLELLQARQERQARLDAGELPDFLPETAEVRAGSWQVAPTPPDLDDRRVEITGPAEAKMMINALNSGAKVFMADLEDALSPTWANVVGGQVALRDAVRRELTFSNPDGKAYTLNDEIATLVVRPRGWHLDEAHVTVDGSPVSASLFDFGLYVFHNAAERLARGTAPYFYLPKLESHLEARLWNDVFVLAQDRLGVPRGSIRATVLIETILAAFEMDEILYELREHASGLNAGRWDYIFSLIKKFHDRPDFTLPDRAQVTMAVPFMRAYTQLLVQTCHRRGAHAIGGMSAFIPNRREPDVTANALEQVRIDKQREAGDGFDGTWVAHPDLVPVAAGVFDEILGERPNQKERMRPDVVASASDLLSVTIDGGAVTMAGVRANVSVALQYLAAWLGGNGAAAINNLMEDAATAEISRSQLWQWLHHAVPLDDGRPMTADLYASIRGEELARLQSGGPSSRLTDAARILDSLVLADAFEPFLTVIAYPYLG